MGAENKEGLENFAATVKKIGFVGAIPALIFSGEIALALVLMGGAAAYWQALMKNKK